MNKNIRWKVLTSVAVLLIFGIVGIYPLIAGRLGIPTPAVLMEKQLKLGLDLKGGVHLVLRVKTDDALRVETESEMERVREALRTANIPVTSITAPSPTEFRIEGATGQDAAIRQATTDALTNFDRNPGANGSYTFTMKPNVASTLREESVEQARQTIERRVNELGVAEPSISRQGDAGDQIQVQLPGVSDVTRAKGVIQSTGLLELKIVENGPFGTREEMLVNGQVPEGMEVLPGVSDTQGAAGTTVYYLVRRAAAVRGTDLRIARPSMDENNQPAVSFTLTPDGSRKFATVTEQNIGRFLAIIVDGRVQSAPRIESRITTDGRISGSFTQEEVQNLALILRSGALPASMDYLQEQVIGPTLGADSIRSGVTASVVGLVLIMVFMLIYYKLSGVNAIVALLFNLIILLGLMAYIGAVMTLPGIAGFVLTMGIGVDSNVLIFERIKEELAAQRGVRAAVNAGFSRVFLTLLDTHVAALISALFLIQFGTGPIRGFAYTLIIGLASNLFTSTFVSKTIFELVLGRRQQVATLSI
ncbi:MAG: protein translocase subunit SecD [Vicinamibacterales bacterium]